MKYTIRKITDYTFISLYEYQFPEKYWMQLQYFVVLRGKQKS